MASVNIQFPDGSFKVFEQGVTPMEIAKSISDGLARNCVVAEVNHRATDLTRPLIEDAELRLITWKDPEAHDVLLHSTAHVMAQAVQRLFPDVKVTIGPAIENRFYYDFDTPKPFTEEDLPLIEAEMQKIIDEDQPVLRREISRNDAIKFFEELDEPYKVEIIREIPEEEILTLYSEGDFTDLCRGPHLLSTGKIPAFKLLSVAGAYWRGDERNKMLSRIYGTAFPSKKQLEAYLNFLEEAKKRDHRRLGKELDLFEISETIGQGLSIWFPKGALLRKKIEDYWYAEHRKRGYDIVQTPHIGKADLWETSGHLGFYKESMYPAMSIEGRDYYIKPMNCPFHIMIYKRRQTSYRDLPLRYAELGTVYRYELSGVLHGLMRVRGFTQDDAHIICTPEQLSDEVEKLLEFSFDYLKAFGFQEYEIYLSTKPAEKFVGEPALWEQAQESLSKSLKKLQIDYKIDEGGGAFYGPKIDIKIKDAIGRMWQCTTIQFDFNEPERFDMVFTTADGTQQRPFMVHRAIMGSLERFIGVLIEHTAGKFPLWYAPVQLKLIPVSDKFAAGAEKIAEAARERDLRVEADLRNERVAYKIREAETLKIPAMIVIGQQEEDSGEYKLRLQGGEEWPAMSLDKLLARLKELEREKR
ncbi:MAG: threonine--tRNA ligase [Candidatus Marinimicrobia bacterium]|jgi:threonyl-tRNA synthetase|nr:threonine--tRNA ligase [Candidatus Neomarinimicrobiota bacterium]MDD5709712.1 threonine--tRNA ligase [Candidatus Neomarinimicrobiota bacterium]MDX9777901.1 threonine--tRNA ligase [bacterium]